VVALLSSLDAGDGRAAMQGIRAGVLHAQARAAGLPLIEARQPPLADNARYEACFARALEAARARWPGMSHVAFGDLHLADIRAWRKDLCARLGWTAVFPLFGLDTATLGQRMIDGGLRAHLCCVDTARLDASFAGRAYDAALLAALPASVDPCGENGEFHTCVEDGPMFDTPVRVEAVGRWQDGPYVRVDFALGDKPPQARPLS
jgi:diphthamide synthase (EF-2-diphthine--ammonia ligase)